MQKTRPIPRKLDRPALWEYAMRLLAARGYSIAEMKTRLTGRAAESSDIQPTIDRLLDLGLLNDQRLAESFARSRLENQGFGQQRVLSDLQRRRVPAAIAKQAAGEVFENTEESELIVAFLKRKFRGRNLSEYLKEPKNLASAYRRLRYAGFGSANVICILKRYSEHAGELETMEETGL